ncbi:hypothetical protein L209DRAFT_775033 [Thermothelomyces heterothallicus CBS 203.75]
MLGGSSLLLGHRLTLGLSTPDFGKPGTLSFTSVPCTLHPKACAFQLNLLPFLSFYLTPPTNRCCGANSRVATNCLLRRPLSDD